MGLVKRTYTDNVTVITAENLNDIQDSIIALEGSEEALGEITIIERNASGAIASFADGADYPVKELIADINATQSGSGDPAPDNVRPISGWSAVNVNVRGANIWDEAWELGYYTGTGTKSNSNTCIRCTNKIPICPNTTYYFKTPNKVALRYYDANETFVSSTGTPATRSTFTSPTNAYYVVFYLEDAYGTTYKNDISINYPSTDTAYHPHNSNATTHNIPLGQTVYGGKLNVTTGELVITHGYWELSPDWAWQKSSSYSGGYYVSGMSSMGYKANTPFICSHAKTATTISQYVSGTCYCDQSLNFRLMSADSVVQDWKNYITAQANANTPIMVVLTLATPTTVTLTPTEVKSLLGQNNIFADSGDVDVTYRASASLVIEQLTNAIISLGGNV